VLVAEGRRELKTYEPFDLNTSKASTYFLKKKVTWLGYWHFSGCFVSENIIVKNNLR
jgi:hypothetical protein